MATAIKRIGKNGSVSYLIGVSKKQADGKYIKITETYIPKAKKDTAIEKEIEKEKFRFEEEVRAGKRGRKSEGTFQDLAERFLANNASISDRTREDYRRMLKNHVYNKIGASLPSDITAGDIEGIFADMKSQKTGTLKKVLACISSVFSYAIRKDKMMIQNPCSFVDLPKRNNEERKESKAFTLEELKTLENALFEPITHTVKTRTRSTSTGELYLVSPYTYQRELSTMYRALFLLALKSGMRRGELTALSWDSLDLDRKKIHIGKAVTKVNGELVKKDPKSEHGIRTITVPSSCIDLLRQWRSEAIFHYQSGDCSIYHGLSFLECPVFIEETTGGRLDPDTITKKFRSFLLGYNESVPEDQKLPVLNFHCLRHTCASLLLKRSGMGVADIAAFMGHTPDVLLKTYAWALGKEGKEAADMWERIDSEDDSRRLAK